MEIEIIPNEDDFINYTCTPENRAIGQAFGKKYDKAFKKRLAELTTDELKIYMAEGKIDINGLEVTEGMLKVAKQFKNEINNDSEWACETSELASVMLYTVKNEELMKRGLSREVTNRIQRLRKTSGISIEDQIEIFYEFVNGASAESEIGRVVQDYA